MLTSSGVTSVHARPFRSSVVAPVSENVSVAEATWVTSLVTSCTEPPLLFTATEGSGTPPEFSC